MNFLLYLKKIFNLKIKTLVIKLLHKLFKQLKKKKIILVKQVNAKDSVTFTYEINEGIINFMINNNIYLHKYSDQKRIRNKIVYDLTFNCSVSIIHFNSVFIFISDFVLHILKGTNIKVQIVMSTILNEQLGLKYNRYEIINTFDPFLYTQDNINNKRKLLDYIKSCIYKYFLKHDSYDGAILNKIEIHYFYIIDNSKVWKNNIKKTFLSL